jgi:hypothetical protein
MGADKAAYLRHVDERDPEFAMEQRHWADDLDRHTPLAFEISIIDQPETDADDPLIGADRATMTLRMKYAMPTGHAKGERGKRAIWPGVFAKLDPDGPGPEPVRWVYAGEEWIEERAAYGDAALGTAGTFSVKYLRGSERVAAQVIEAFPSAKAHADDFFKINVTRHIQIKLYQDMEHLKAWVYLSMPDEYLGGWNEPGESIKFMASYTTGVSKWRGAFAHEYGHVATWELGPAAKNMPWWMMEGIAELAAEPFTKNGESIHRMMLRLADKGTLCPWPDISDYDKAEQRVKRLAYNQGQHLMAYVTERWGAERRNRWLRDVANGTTLEEATNGALGVIFTELDASWRRSLIEGTESEAIEAEKKRTPPGGD